MINLETKNDELMKELSFGNERVRYWFVKNNGGEKGVYKLDERLKREARRSSSGVATSDVVEYIDKNGNRWRAMEIARYYSDVNHVAVNLITFVYYETYGSCGAFVPSYSKLKGGNIVGCIMFTSHFFLRMCQRLGIEYRSSAMIGKFLELMQGFAVSVHDEMRKGMHEVSVALMGSAGFGVLRSLEPQIVEIDTFLTIPELTRKQKKRIIETFEYSERARKEPIEVTAKRAMSMSRKEQLDETIDHLVKNLGVEKEVAEDAVVIMNYCIYVLERLGYGGDDVKDCVAIAENIENLMGDVVSASYRMHNKVDFEDARSIYEVVLCAERLAHVYGVKDFDVFRVTNEVLEEAYKSDKIDEGEKDLLLDEYNEYKSRVEKFEQKADIEKEKFVKSYEGKKYRVKTI